MLRDNRYLFIFPKVIVIGSLCGSLIAFTINNY